MRNMSSLLVNHLVRELVLVAAEGYLYNSISDERSSLWRLTGRYQEVMADNPLEYYGKMHTDNTHLHKHIGGPGAYACD